MPFDLAQFENLESGSFNARRQNGDEMLIDGKPVIFKMHGPGSKPQVAAEFKKAQAASVAGMAILQGRQGRDAARDAFNREAEYLAACTIAVENWPGDGGALAIYMNPKLGYMTKQAEVYLKEDANFMPGSVKP